MFAPVAMFKYICVIKAIVVVKEVDIYLLHPFVSVRIVCNLLLCKYSVIVCFDNLYHDLHVQM